MGPFVLGLFLMLVHCVWPQGLTWVCDSVPHPVLIILMVAVTLIGGTTQDLTVSVLSGMASYIIARYTEFPLFVQMNAAFGAYAAIFCGGRLLQTKGRRVTLWTMPLAAAILGLAWWQHWPFAQVWVGVMIVAGLVLTWAFARYEHTTLPPPASSARRTVTVIDPREAFRS